MELPKACLISTFKDEGPFLLEWVSHHKAIGFTELVIASNDCLDGTDLMLDRLQEMGIVTHIPNPGPYKLNIQGDAYQAARKSKAAQSCDWIMALDADEFLNIHTGDHSLQALLSNLDKDVDAVVVNWRIFGDGGQSGYKPEPITELFTLAQSPKTKQWPVKTLFRDDPDFLQIRPHGPWSDPQKIEVAPKFVVTADGVRLENNLFNGQSPFRVTRWKHRSWKTAQINHYVTKTKELFLDKVRKGTAWPNRFSEQRLSLEFFDKMNYNDDLDETIKALEKERGDIFDDFLKDERLRDLHVSSCERLAASISKVN